MDLDIYSEIVDLINNKIMGREVMLLFWKMRFFFFWIEKWYFIWDIFFEKRYLNHKTSANG